MITGFTVLIVLMLVLAWSFSGRWQAVSDGQGGAYRVNTRTGEAEHLVGTRSRKIEPAPRIVQVDGVGPVEFPGTMTDSEIRAALKKSFPDKYP